MARKHRNGATELHDAAVLHSLSLGGRKKKKKIKKKNQCYYPFALAAKEAAMSKWDPLDAHTAWTVCAPGSCPPWPLGYNKYPLAGVIIVLKSEV